MTMVKIILAAVLVLLLVIGCYEFKELKAEREQLRNELAIAREETKNQARELEDQKQALIDNEATNKRLGNETAALRAKLKEVYENDEAAEVWRDSPCPAGVGDCLLN